MVKNLKAVFRKFNTEAKCREFLIQQRWGGTPICPYCNSTKQYVIDDGKRFKCANNECYKKYSVTLGTVMESSNIPLTTWLPAIYIIHSHKKGISSVQFAKDLGVTQKTGWFMLHRIREFMKDNHPDMLSGTVEVDETYLGKKFRSDFKGATELQIDKKMLSPRQSKGLVFGMAQRGGKVMVKSFSDPNAEILKQTIKDNVLPGSNLYTDQSGLYRAGLDEFVRGAVRHNAVPNEFVRGDIHVNNIETFWSTLKRGVYGTYHQISYKHLQAYLNEFSMRHNSRHIKDGERFVNSLKHIEGRLSYKQLVYGKNSQESQTEGQETGQ